MGHLESVCCKVPGEDADVSNEGPGDSAFEGGLEVVGEPTAAIEPSEGSLYKRLYNVANSGFEWSSVIARRGGKQKLSLFAVNIEQPASQFVTGRLEATQDLMHRQRPAVRHVADGGAHDPARGSPSAASTCVIRDDKVWSSAPDGGLCLLGSDSATDEPAVQTQQCSRPQRPQRRLCRKRNSAAKSGDNVRR